MKSKGIKIDADVHKELMILKFEKGFRTVSDVIRYLIQIYKKSSLRMDDDAVNKRKAKKRKKSSKI